jgi:uncharacterized membrane protein
MSGVNTNIIEEVARNVVRSYIERDYLIMHFSEFTLIMVLIILITVYFAWVVYLNYKKNHAQNNFIMSLSEKEISRYYREMNK